MPFIQECNVYYDNEAYFSYNHISGQMDKPNPKYRLFIRKVVGFFIFLFITSQKWENKKYIEINNNDWLWKNNKYLNNKSRVEICNCCKLKKKEIWNKRKRNKIKKVAQVKPDLIDRIRMAYEETNYIIPKKTSSNNIPLEFAFEKEKVVVDIAKKLGIFK